ncbi:hypothetical protein H2200_012879 [Cladophialophora chaetospira]|uniref:Uncharacterized protein n=1 Tax=Cladophialophora chaetospira TaxID=386627 RepID=A0AA38WX11_9EURO|nr:hypothetical protein H2200_012879 [Cladophialophora chaetospira]
MAQIISFAGGGRSLSELEALPLELIQRIFFESCNGNLLLAAPRIAAGLSGTESIYHVAYIIAFYHQHLDEISKLFGLEHWTATTARPFKQWDIRSWTKAVLRSRWCTCGWVRTFTLELRQKVLDDTLATLQRGDDFLGQRELELRAVKAFTDAGKAIADRVPYPEPTSLWPLTFHDFGLNFYVEWEHDDGDENEQLDSPFPAYADIDYTFRHIPWTLCGAMSFRCSGMHVDAYDICSPFADLVHKEQILFYNTLMAYNQLKDDTPVNAARGWDYLVHEDLIRDYYLYPEDAPFKIKPVLFRIIALAAMAYYPVGDARTVNGTRHVILLFEADPTSLPWTDPVILRYAHYLAERLQNTQRQRVQYRFHMRKLRGDDNLTPRMHESACNWHRQTIYSDAMDRLILSYILTGRQEMLPNKDQMSPTILDRSIHQLFVKYSEEVYIASEDEGDLEDNLAETERTIRDDPLLQMWRESEIFAKQDVLKTEVEGLARAYLDLTPPPTPDDVERLRNLLHTYTYDEGGLTWETKFAVDWGVHEELLDEDFLRRLSDTAEPWPQYEWPVWFARD